MTRQKRDYSKIHAMKFKENFETSTKSYKDERFWVLSKDETGGSAIIRFLPNKNEKELPFKIQFKHSIWLNGKNFIDRCPTTIGKECPVCDWNKTQSRDFVKTNKMYRNRHWIANILVISDPKNRENEGKVFLFEFGTQIYEILKEAISPTPDTDEEELGLASEPKEPLYFYCPDNGANFKLKFKRKNKNDMGTWLESTFLKPSPIDNDLKNLNITDESWTESLYDLDEVITTQGYKEYNELKAKFNKFLANINMSNITEMDNIEKTESDAQESYSRKKDSATKKVENKPNDDPADTEDEKPKDIKKEEPKKRESIKNVSESTAKKVGNYFQKFEDED